MSAIARRVRGYGRGDRILGVDVARGLAVLGMFGAHVGVIPAFDWSSPSSWTAVVSGRSSILFALLAGVSIAILTGRGEPFAGRALWQARARIALRAVVVFLIGALLDLLGTNVAVILTYYAVYFLLALPFVRWRPSGLFALAAAIAVAMPLALRPWQEAYNPARPNLLAELFATGYYPALLWIAFVLTGIGIGRLDLSALRVRLGLVAVGAGLTIAGYGLGAAASTVTDEFWATTEPHSGSPFEAVGSTGFAVAVLGLCLLIPFGARWVAFPVAAVGSMALSAYTAQVVAIAALEVEVPGTTDQWPWFWFGLVALATCSAWALLLGRGPLESALAWLTGLVGRSRAQDPAATGQ